MRCWWRNIRYRQSEVDSVNLTDVLFQRRIDYGVMTSCLVKPALYIVQKTGPRLRLAEPSLAETESEQEEDTGQPLTHHLLLLLLAGLQFLM